MLPSLAVDAADSISAPRLPPFPTGDLAPLLRIPARGRITGSEGDRLSVWMEELPLKRPAAVTPAKMSLIGAGWFGYQVFWAFHGGPMPLFLRGLTASKFEISPVLSLAGLAGCLVPPVVGLLSDRSVSRFGCRRPYIFSGFLIVLLCLLFLPRVGAFWIVALLAASMYFAFRFSETPYLALLPDVTPPERRSTASGVMNLLGSVGLIACFAVGSSLWDDHPAAVFTAREGPRRWSA